MENIINNFRNIIIGAFLFGLFYRVARSLVFDNFIWIVVFPLVAIWLIYKGVLKTFKFNSLDRIFYYYFLYGIVITIVGLVVSPGNKVNPDTFLHVYLPAPLYFISRIYYYYRIEKSTELYRWLMIISGILILDIFIEYYVFIITESSESIPWVRHSMKGAESWGVAIWNYSSQSYDAPTNFMTIFASAKTGGLFVATIFCALLPLAVAGRIKSNTFSTIAGKNNLLVYLLLIALFHSSLLIPSLANSASLIVISSLIIIKKVKLKHMLLFPVVLVLLYLSYKDVLMKHYTNELLSFNSYNKNSLEFIFQLRPLVETYSKSNPLAIIFSTSVVPSFAISSMTELDIFLLPLKYGLGWLIIVSVGGYRILRYQLALVRSRKAIVSILGLSFFGIFGVVVTNLHYPKFYAHGVYELFLLSMGATSAIYQRYIEQHYFCSD